MRRGLYYIIRTIAIFSRIFRKRALYMYFMTKAHSINGVTFIGKPRFIHPNVVLDATANIILGDNIVISMGALFLTHDYSYTTGLKAINEKPQTDIAILSPIKVGDNCFIGANSIILPGTVIGSNVIVGAGSVVKGVIPDFSGITGNPAKIITDIRDWARIKKETVDPKSLLKDKR
jgi:acetyltransferase-like isoleucine patch superfamily enzyme